MDQNDRIKAFQETYYPELIPYREKCHLHSGFSIDIDSLREIGNHQKLSTHPEFQRNECSK